MAFPEIEEISNSSAFDVNINVFNAKLYDKRIEKVGNRACVLLPED